MLDSSAGVNLEGVRSWEVQCEWLGQERSSPQPESAAAGGCVPALKKGRQVLTAAGIPHEAK